MSEVLHANIFFVIASVATVFFCILVSVALYQLIKILQSIRAILDRLEAGSEAIADDIATVRSLVLSGGIISRIFSFFTDSTSTRRSRSRKSTALIQNDNE